MEEGARRSVTRRRLLGTAAALAVVSGCATPAVPATSKRQRRIGILSSGPVSAPAQIAAFHDGMKNEGLAEGDDYALEVRGADGDSGRLVPLARELVALDIDVLLTVTTGSTQAARAVTSSLPIVMVAAHDPVEAGVVADLARPGGNVTGQSLMGGDLMPKQIEILSGLAEIRRLAYLTPYVPSPAAGYPSVTDIFERSMRDKAGRAGIEVYSVTMRTPADLDSALAAAGSVDALYLIESATWFAPPTQPPIERVIGFSIGRRIPSIAGARVYAERGLLMTYGDARPIPELFRSVTRFVARILRGARPADLPVDRPTAFELVLNSKTATATGLTFPKPLLDRADAVIR